MQTSDTFEIFVYPVCANSFSGSNFNTIFVQFLVEFEILLNFTFGQEKLSGLPGVFS